MKNKNLKISVITPSYNSGKYIERAIKSVLVQDYRNFEHIIVDGGSTDDTVGILRKYKHLKWISEPDKGQADAMNKGFRMSTGNVIVYLNADDYFFEGAFSAVVEKFMKGADFVVGNVLVRSSRLKTEFLNTPRITLEGMLRHWEPNAFCHNSVGYFYTRKVQESCPFNADNYDAMDLEFLLDAATRFSFVKVEKTLGCFEDGKDTKTGKTQSRLDYWRPEMFPYINRHLSKLSDEQRTKFSDDRMRGYAMMQAHMNRINQDLFQPIPVEKLPSISVIIPTYNCARYITRAVDSVLSQRLQNIEILVIDDASTDGTQGVLNKHYQKNNAVKIIRHSENKKLGAARNTGIDAATGKYLFFLDADDWLADGPLAHLSSIAEEYGAEIVACGIDKVWQQDRRETYHSEALSCNGGLESLHHLANYRIASVVWNKLYLREFVENNGLRFAVPYWHEDVMFTTNAVYLCRKYISINNTDYSYFQRDASIISSRKTELHLRSYIRLYADMIEFIERNGICKDKKGVRLCEALLKSHCTDEIFPKVIDYIKTHTDEEWERECRDALIAELGVKGYALASYVIEAMKGKRECQVAENKPVNAFSPRRLMRKHFGYLIHGRFRQPLKRAYSTMTKIARYIGR